MSDNVRYLNGKPPEMDKSYADSVKSIVKKIKALPEGELLVVHYVPATENLAVFTTPMTMPTAAYLAEMAKQLQIPAMMAYDEE